MPVYRAACHCRYISSNCLSLLIRRENNMWDTFSSQNNVSVWIFAFMLYKHFQIAFSMVSSRKLYFLRLIFLVWQSSLPKRRHVQYCVRLKVTQLTYKRMCIKAIFGNLISERLGSQPSHSIYLSTAS